MNYNLKLEICVTNRMLFEFKAILDICPKRWRTFRLMLDGLGVSSNQYQETRISVSSNFNYIQKLLQKKR